MLEQNNLQLHKDLIAVQERVDKGECDSGKALEDGFDHLNVDTAELQSVTENSDYLAKRITFKLCGLKEDLEGDDLAHYLEEVFTGCLRADTDIVI